MLTQGECEKIFETYLSLSVAPEEARGRSMAERLTPEEVEIAAMPKDLPEYIEVDLSEMDAGDAVMLSELKLPEGVELPALAIEEEDNDTAVANAIHIKADQGTGAAAAAEAEAAAADELGEAGAPAAEEEAPAEGDEEESEG